jgi:hypothetical protein
MRSAIATLVGRMDKKEQEALRKKQCASPLALLDKSVPPEGDVLALAYYRSMVMGGVLAVTSKRSIFVTASIKRGRFPRSTSYLRRQGHIRHPIDSRANNLAY